ncbi:hypothetical protein [Photobacterium angustum]|nr:hypothetical protein [Photobacterium angustum]
MNIELKSYDIVIKEHNQAEMRSNSQINASAKHQIRQSISNLKNPLSRQFLKNALTKNDFDMEKTNQGFADMQKTFKLFNKQISVILKNQLLAISHYFLIFDITTVIAVANFMQDINDAFGLGKRTLIIPEIDEQGNLVDHSHAYTNKMVSFINSVGISMIINNRDEAFKKAANIFKTLPIKEENTYSSAQYSPRKRKYDDDSFTNGSSFDCSVCPENEFEHWY